MLNLNKIWTSIYRRIITIIVKMANIVGTLTKDGVQIPLDPAILGEDAKLFFRMGEFAGWVIEG